jgi:P27 family predicted phage terminase small subunit
MGKRGPAPTPTALKLLRGETRPSQINTNEPQPGAGEVVCPEWVSDDGRQVWDRLAPDLVAKGVLTPWDVDSFADLCELVIINRVALADVQANGNAIVTVERELSNGTLLFRTQKNPNWQIAKESTGLLVTLGGRFGLNPSDRQQLSVGGGEAHGQGADRLLS